MAMNSLRIALVACLVGLMVVPAASPVLSKEQSSCPRFDPVEPKSDSEQTQKALSAEILWIEDDADPVVTDFEVGTNLWIPGGASGDRPVMEDTKFFNLQVVSDSTREFTLNTKLMWDSPRQLADLDLFIYDARGEEIQRSDKPMGQPQSKEVVSAPARRCEGFTVEVRALRTAGANGTLEMWLGKSR